MCLSKKLQLWPKVMSSFCQFTSLLYSTILLKIHMNKRIQSSLHQSVVHHFSVSPVTPFWSIKQLSNGQFWSDTQRPTDHLMRTAPAELTSADLIGWLRHHFWGLRCIGFMGPSGNKAVFTTDGKILQ